MKDNATARRSGQGLCLCIRDNGVGMAPRTLARLGELYWQGGEFTEGKGKGFAFARGVAHAHGGMLDIVTALGVGTTAFLVIPFVE